jgi:PAS domain S-box-containing protein
MFFLDVDNCIVDWNIGAERITGYSEAEILGERGSIIFTPEDISAGAHEQELAKARTEGRAENERWHVRKDGGLFWGSGVVMPLRDESGNLIGYAKVMRDFTERRCAQQERDELLEREQKARAEAEAANRTRDTFIGVISHELRSPLQTILGWVDLLCQGRLDPEMESRAIETIQRNAALQNRLINDLLDITRIEAGTLSLNVAPVDLRNVVKAVMDNVRPIADGKGVRLRAVIAPDMEPVSGDAERLQQVVTNLLNNAIKFTPAGGRWKCALHARAPQRQRCQKQFWKSPIAASASAPIFYRTSSKPIRRPVLALVTSRRALVWGFPLFKNWYVYTAAASGLKARVLAKAPPLPCAYL